MKHTFLLSAFLLLFTTLNAQQKQGEKETARQPVQTGKTTAKEKKKSASAQATVKENKDTKKDQAKETYVNKVKTTDKHHKAVMEFIKGRKGTTKKPLKAAAKKAEEKKKAKPEN